MIRLHFINHIDREKLQDIFEWAVTNYGMPHTSKYCWAWVYVGIPDLRNIIKGIELPDEEAAVAFKLKFGDL
jgi:hypothetical protein